mgnify:CR=1 FL=1|jgi:hypothetical protein
MRKCPSTAVVPTEAEQPTALTFAERSGVEITRSTAKCRGSGFHILEAPVCRSTVICKLVAVVLKLREAVLGRSVEPLGNISE